MVQPFGGLDVAAAGRFAFAAQIFVGELGEDGQRFGMQALHQFEDTFEVGGEFLAVGGVAALAILNIFGEQEALGDGDVTQEIAGGEFYRRIGPVNLVWRNKNCDAHGTFAHVVEIFQEWSDGGDFHCNLGRFPDFSVTAKLR